MSAIDIQRIRRLIPVYIRYLKITEFPFKPLMRRIAGGEILLFASGIAFSAILTMVPLLLISGSALGIMLQSSEQGVAKLEAVLATVFPEQPFATNIKQSILQVVTDIISYRTSLGIVGFAVLVVTATSLFDVVRTVLHRIYGIRRTKNLLASFLHDIGFVAAAWVLLVVSNLTLWAADFLDRLLYKFAFWSEMHEAWWVGSIPSTVVYILIAVMFYIVYRNLTDTKPPRTAAIVSTVTMTVLWIISAKLFALYLSTFSAISTLYGGYAFILVLLFWVYYSSLVFVIGAMAGQVYWEFKKPMLAQKASGVPPGV
ncbi:MAG: ribonuclease [Bacteroidetes bacterium]|nr:ribonuclease [Bacteroidota bacterium]